MAKLTKMPRYNGPLCRVNPEHGSERYTGTGHCVVCCRNRVHAEYQKPEVQKRVRQSARIRHAENKERANAACRAWHEANKTERNPKKAQYMRENRARWRTSAANRRAKDLNYRMLKSLRARMGRAIHRRQKGGSAIRDLGCSVDFLIRYIGAQFRGGMTWENWATVWQLDHRRALSHFDLTDRSQFLQAAHYTNLQPLFVLEHREKTRRDNAERRNGLAPYGRRITADEGGALHASK